MLPILSAMSDQTRLAAMRLLYDGDEHCVCELMRVIGATQSRMSRHMQALKQAGLVVDRRDAQWVRYRMPPDLSPDLKALLDAVFRAETQMNRERNAA